MESKTTEVDGLSESLKDHAEESSQQMHTLRKIYQVLNKTVSKVLK